MMKNRLSSIWERGDAELLDLMIPFYFGSVTKILDATFNTGKMWKGSSHRGLVTSMDLNPKYNTDYVCDNSVMTDVPSDYFDVVVYDPPHISDANGKRGDDWSDRYGITGENTNTDQLSSMYPGFLVQANRVLKSTGGVIAKICDQVYNHRYRWSHVDFIKFAEQSGFTACDMIIKVRPHGMIDPKWKIGHHARKRHTYFILLRKGGSCEGHHHAL